MTDFANFISQISGNQARHPQKPFLTVEGQLESLREWAAKPIDFKVGDRVVQNTYGNNLRFPEKGQVAIIGTIFPQYLMDHIGDGVNAEILLLTSSDKFQKQSIDLRCYKKIADDAEA